MPSKLKVKIRLFLRLSVQPVKGINIMDSPRVSSYSSLCLFFFSINLNNKQAIYRNSLSHTEIATKLHKLPCPNNQTTKMQFNSIVFLLAVASQVYAANAQDVAAEKRDVAQGIQQVGKVVAADASNVGKQVAQVGAKVGAAGSKYGSTLGKGALIGAAGLGVADLIYEYGKHVEHNKAISESMAMSQAAASATLAFAATATHGSTLITAYITK